MGVVNVTPNSFSDGGLHATTEAAIAHGRRLADEGAGILDIGGESTRPGSDPVGVEEEAARVLPVIKGLRDAGTILSVDTRKSAIMHRAAESGAHILNDVSAFTYDADSMKAAADSGLPVVLMHALGDPKTMQDNPDYEDVVLEVFDYLEQRIEACQRAGIERSKIIADVGIGFGKTLEHNLALLKALALFHSLGVALLLGASRKRFIGGILDEPDPSRFASSSDVEGSSDRLAGSLASATVAIMNGASIVRAHDVRETVDVARICHAIRDGRNPLQRTGGLGVEV